MKVISAAANISQAFKNVGRVTEILGVFVTHGFADLLYRMRLSRLIPSRFSANIRYQHLPPAERLRLSFEELGPTFVKLGQLLASRPDIIPEAFVDEFEKLQDKVVSVPFPEIRRFVESELRAPLSVIFQSFDEHPMAAASIAQVHPATLKSGELVAVKVQRPGIEKLVHNDISILRGFAQLLERYVPETQVFNPTGLVEEFFKTILYELDFLVEANNIRRIKKNLAHFSKISIPQVFEAHSTSRILVLERFEGIRFSDREAIVRQGINPMEIVEVGSDAFFHMVMQDGLFHGDLHAGNLFVLPDGKIGIVDFGIVGRLSRRVQDSLIAMFTALVEEDFETLASEYIDLSQTAGDLDISLFQKDLMDNISPYMGMSLGQLNVGRILLRSTAIATKHRLQVPRELMLLFKAIFTIEGLGKKLEPNFDILQVANRLARQTLSSRYSKERVMRDLIVVGRDLQTLLETTPRLLKRFLKKWGQNNFAIETRNRDIESLSHSLRVLTYHFVLSVLCIGFYGVGIAFTYLGTGPSILGVPMWGILPIVIATALLAYRLWTLRKYNK